MHDPRVGRFFATDPLEAKYPWNSPYSFSENKVINSVELEGLEHHQKFYSQRVCLHFSIIHSHPCITQIFFFCIQIDCGYFLRNSKLFLKIEKGASSL